MQLSRRSLVATGVALPALVACSPEDPTLDQVDRAESGTVVARTTDVPVGGCFVVAAAATVITQPEEGTFKAFSGVCTHKHCFLASSQDGTIPCKCHGSTFDLTDGSVLSGPATEALEEYEITVEDGKVTLA